ncbi:protein krueppel-like [Homarus americanus]|uniref:protein krueppel-like n=1 Tax=Homarus americanus TaxID=6706 RepID=UPI001C47E8D4|nr:protein krueppel-like [Homarus americanus]
MTQNSLMAHMEVHNERKRFECTFCKKKFKRKEKLKYHERIHTGERPFQCQLCVRGFVSKTKLDDHVSRHRGDRRYRCSYCTKTYAGAWDLKQHIRKVHDKQCEKVAVTVVASNQAITGNTTLTQVSHILIW